MCRRNLTNLATFKLTTGHTPEIVWSGWGGKRYKRYPHAHIRGMCYWSDTDEIWNWYGTPHPREKLIQSYIKRVPIKNAGGYVRTTILKTQHPVPKHPLKGFFFLPDFLRCGHCEKKLKKLGYAS